MDGHFGVCPASVAEVGPSGTPKKPTTTTRPYKRNCHGQNSLQGDSTGVLRGPYESPTRLYIRSSDSGSYTGLLLLGPSTLPMLHATQ